MIKESITHFCRKPNIIPKQGVQWDHIGRSGGKYTVVIVEPRHHLGPHFESRWGMDMIRCTQTRE
jgi:hypothetical protein